MISPEFQLETIIKKQGFDVHTCAIQGDEFRLAVKIYENLHSGMEIYKMKDDPYIIYSLNISLSQKQYEKFNGYSKEKKSKFLSELESFLKTLDLTNFEITDEKTHGLNVWLYCAIKEENFSLEIHDKFLKVIQNAGSSLNQFLKIK